MKHLLSIAVATGIFLSSTLAFAAPTHNPTKDRVAARVNTVRTDAKALLRALEDGRQYCNSPKLETGTDSFMDMARTLQKNVRKEDSTYSDIQAEFADLEKQWFVVNRLFDCTSITVEIHRSWTALFGAFGELREIVSKL